MSVRPHRIVPTAAAVTLYAMTLVLELPGIWCRFVIAAAILAGLGTQDPADISSLVAMAPVLWSLAAFAFPGRGWWWRQRSGGRRPSQRERDAVDRILIGFRGAGSRTRLPKAWFVLDDPTPAAAVCGSAMLLHRGLIDSPDLSGIVAHELGHLNSIDGRMMDALNRLVIWGDLLGKGATYREYVVGTGGRGDPIWFVGVKLIRGYFRVLLIAMGGGLGTLALRPIWCAFWRRREYAADRYAASLGEADNLRDFLETHSLFFDVPVPYLWLSDATHPPVELRLDRLSS